MGVKKDAEAATATARAKGRGATPSDEAADTAIGNIKTDKVLFRTSEKSVSCKRWRLPAVFRNSRS